MDSLLFECAALGIDALLFSICYRFYRMKSESEKSLKNATTLDIDNKLPEKVKTAGGVISYAVIRGSVKATASTLRSQYLPHVRGVIREKITKERKIKWSPVLRIWNTVEQDIQRSYDNVPFSLVGSGHWFKSKVEIEDPISAEELVLPTLYDHFFSNDGNLKDAFVGWFRGERTTGIHEIENMLAEDTVLTGVGELTLENNVLKLRPPVSGYNFYLTTMTLDSLMKKLNNDVKFLKIMSVLFGCIGICIVSSLVWKYYRARKSKMEIEKMKRKQQEARQQRRLTDPYRNEEESGMPVCVVCLTQRVEAVILECGHACLCLDCSQRIQRYCPVCRSTIERVVPAYLP